MTSNADQGSLGPAPPGGADPRTLADLAPLSAVYVSMHLEVLVGFREECDEHDDNYHNLAQRSPAPDACPPLIVLPLRTNADTYDPFLADVIACAMGSDHAESAYVLDNDDDDDDAADDAANRDYYTLDVARTDHFPFIQCSSSTVAPLVSPNYRTTPELLRQQGKWRVESADDSAMITALAAPQAPDGADMLLVAHPLNTYSFRPFVLKTPQFILQQIFTFSNDVSDDHKTLICHPLASMRSSLLTQLNPSCHLRMLMQFGNPAVPDDETQMLVALKRLATYLWIGGEEKLVKAVVHPDRRAQLCLLTESATLRTCPLNSVAKSILKEDWDVNPYAGVPNHYPPAGTGSIIRGPRDLGNVKFYNEFAAVILGPAPGNDEIRERLKKRAAVERALLARIGHDQTAPLRIRFDDPVRLQEYARHNIDVERAVADEVYLIWRARSVNQLADLLSLHIYHSDGTRDPAIIGDFAPTFDLSALRASRRREFTNNGPVHVNLFPCTLEPKLALAWSRVCAGLAHQAAYPTCPPEPAQAEEEKEEEEQEEKDIDFTEYIDLSQCDDTPAAAVREVDGLVGKNHIPRICRPKLGEIEVPDYVEVPELRDVFLPRMDSNNDHLSDDDHDVPLPNAMDDPVYTADNDDDIDDLFADIIIPDAIAAGITRVVNDLCGDLLVPDGATAGNVDSIGALLADMPDADAYASDTDDIITAALLEDMRNVDASAAEMDARAADTAAAGAADRNSPANTEFDTGYFQWLGLTADDIAVLNDFVARGKICNADIVDDDGVLRSFEREE